MKNFDDEVERLNFYLKDCEKENESLRKKVERYEKALFAVLTLSYATDQDILADIITVTLGGFELKEQFEGFAKKGEEEFLAHFHKEE